MEEIPANQTPQQNQQEVNRSPVPDGTGKGLFGILFIIIVIALFLGALNYFNILHLSKLFPNYLGFLPHRPYEQSLKIENGNTKQGFPTSIPNFSPNVFQYDKEKAKTILAKHIKDNIKQEVLPQILNIKQGLSVDNKIEESLKNLFGSYITNNNEDISITFHYKEGTNIPNDFMIFVQQSKTKQTTINATQANTLVSSYFIDPFQIEDCNTKGSTTYCEEFKIESDGKRGFGAIIAEDPSKSPPSPTSIAFSCFIPKESKDYDGMKSCISP